MVAKSELKFIKRLHQKKYRNQEGLFLAEGPKVVGEFLEAGWQPRMLYSVNPENYPDAQAITPTELDKISTLVQPNEVLGVFPVPDIGKPVLEGWSLALDGVRDPGNLGTLIRLCDWFGIPQLLCSQDTVEAYNPKVVQAAMGSLARVRVHAVELPEFLRTCGLPAIGASMEGEAAPGLAFGKEGILVMGSESHGVSAQVREHLSATVAIPSHGKAESLNVAMAAGILLYELRR
ncbi:RNA methyltransferase, TrmH family [Robiginitalea myxolifaciens]|uniref:RNA methyltransferase, TrmH family n=1 Tax=Robiginitalea myxolifaciens TaxID=400055 RepID=A0A1I6FQC4_9FLAO|nr:RNA methyltransferase [Robiginitalea myxolifaciens]SFR32150.1 RNA methyltransferase, TrmH family [Robiginitalea myxolifaciens]